MSLGTFPDEKLADARKKRDILRAEIAQGKNPVLDRKAEKKNSVAESKHLFKAIATEWLQNSLLAGHKAIQNSPIAILKCMSSPT